jgi:hypothetical protein
MVNTLSYQMYRHERGFTAAEQRAQDARAGETAVALRDLRLSLGRGLRLGHRASARGVADAVTASVRFGVECTVREG